MTRRFASILAGTATTAAVAALAACGGGSRNAGVCSNADGALANTSFVFLQAPRSGERVSSGFGVAGCSSTFEGTVSWRLRARDGRVLASGFTQGGSLELGSLHFTVTFSVAARQVGLLEVYEPTVTGEGFPPVRNVVPLVLEP
jgi:hypothetical protein